VEILDRDIHTERRRVFWQTCYVSALEKLLGLGQPYPGAPPPDPEILARWAAAHAAQAVKQFDRWEAEQAAPARANTGVRPPGPDPEDSPYLGDSR
jgi:hypothetical protein